MDSLSGSDGPVASLLDLQRHNVNLIRRGLGSKEVTLMRIEADQVCVDYNGRVALYDASLHLPAGSICGLVGMNGAGKSTLFKALTGFGALRGRIRINGQRVAQAQREQAAAYVPQSESIDCGFPVSVWDVVMMGATAP